jgi:hypothetical protein
MARSITWSTLPLLVSLMAGDGALAACVGDCNGDERVSVDELIKAVGIALGHDPVDVCPEADPDDDGVTSLDELISAIHSSLGQCDVATPSPSPSPTPSPTPLEQVPTSGQDLLPWLQAGSYLGWRAESEIHQSAGPHGRVRVFLNDALYDSLDGDLPQHPAGSAAVKELYDIGADVVRGWAVEVKVQAESDLGAGWYWYESFNGNVFADGFGVRGCTVCHSAGTDYVLIPFPLR